MVSLPKQAARIKFALISGSILHGPDRAPGCAAVLAVAAAVLAAQSGPPAPKPAGSARGFAPLPVNAGAPPESLRLPARRVAAGRCRAALET